MNPKTPCHIDLLSPVIPKVKSMIKINREKMIEATTTMIVLLCNSFQVGHDTL
jgi:hypothetical protein